MRFTFFKRSSKNKQSAPAWNANSDRLNLGCGAHFHPAWLNLDLSPASPQVMPMICEPRCLFQMAGSPWFIIPCAGAF